MIRSIFLRLAVAASLLLTCSSGLAQTAPELIAAGDVYDAQFKGAEALKYYLPAEKMEPKNVALLVRIARQYRHLLTDASAKEEKLKYGNMALEYGKRAAAYAPNDADAQLSCAITYGRMLPHMATKDQVASIPLIKTGSERAIALDPRHENAWHVLGRWHQVLADMGMVKHALSRLIYGKLPTTTNEEAVKCFDQAIAINPQRPRHYIELGRTYAQMGKTAEARKALEKGLKLPDLDKDDTDLKPRGREALAKLP
ncbi:MAG: tetratricopeptide repeat protein [Verrucomicrobiota bacterium]